MADHISLLMRSSPNLGKPQFASHSWLEPVIVVSIMIASLVVNRRHNYSIISRRRSSARPLLDDMSDTDSPDPLAGEEYTTQTTENPRKNRNCFGFAITTPNSSRFANHWHSRILQKFPFLVEMFYWALNFLAYSSTKALAAKLYSKSGNGVVELAQEHGIGILNLEHKSILRFLFPIEESNFQLFFMGHPIAMTFLNRIYSLVHIPGTVAFLSWYYYAAPDHSIFAVARRTMTLGNFAAFFIFCFFPCMPPRLLPKSFNFHDTVRQDHADSVWVGGKNVNQLAAMPSLHFTYAFVIGCTFIHHSGLIRTIQGKPRTKSIFLQVAWALAGVVYPLLVLTVIVATANHYWLDAVVALFTTTLSFFGNRVWMTLLPAEDVLLWCLRLEKPIPTTGDRLQAERGRTMRRKSKIMSIV